MKLITTEKLDHTVDIELASGTIWHIVGVHEDILEELDDELESTSSEPTAKVKPSFL